MENTPAVREKTPPKGPARGGGGSPAPFAYPADDFYGRVACLNRLYEKRMLAERALAEQIKVEASLFVQAEISRQVNEALDWRRLSKSLLKSR